MNSNARGGTQPGAGRPEIGKPVQIRFAPDLRDRIDTYAAAHSVTFAEGIRTLSEESLTAWEKSLGTEAWLISCAPGDDLGAEGADAALVDHLDVFRRNDVTEWMATQGYGPDDPDEAMYLATEPPEPGWESMKLDLSPVDAARFEAALEDLRQQAADLNG